MHTVARWTPGTPRFTPSAVLDAVAQHTLPAYVLHDPETHAIGVATDGTLHPHTHPTGLPVLGVLAPVHAEWLGDRTFNEQHNTRFPYVVGEMANGIATVRMVIAAAEAGLLGFFGAAGLHYDRVATAIDELTRALGDRHAWGVNLIHSPNEPSLENRVAELLLARNVRRISASAFMDLAPSVVRCAATGLRRDASGRIHRKHFVFAKISRAEVARKFMVPPPAEMLRALVAQRAITAEEAELAALIPVASDITVEADSGGHTDNQSLTALLPSILRLRDSLRGQSRVPMPLRIGAAGGLGTPSALAAAFSMGAAYVLTGSVNQCAVESGLSPEGREMLTKAAVPDVMMAPAADMFELGVRVQVLRRATMFGPRAQKLYEAYQSHPSLEAIAPAERAKLERDVLHATFDEIWADTKRFWQNRDPEEVARAEADPKHRMALVFRWYLGRASKWAIDGDVPRKADYQIWCGPAMGAFNDWVSGTFLADARERTTAQIALNLLEGAASVLRASELRTHGVPVPAEGFDVRPRRLG